MSESVWPAEPLVTPWDGMKLSAPERAATDYPSTAAVTWTAVPAPRAATEEASKETTAPSV